MRQLRLPLLVLSLVLAANPSPAQVRVPALFSDHMVLQQNIETPVWGWADPGAQVTVRFDRSTISTKADAEGRWSLRLPARPATNIPLQMQIASGDASLNLNDVVVGEVWVCSGQSNMKWPVAKVNDGDLEALAANYPDIRMITVPNLGTQEVQTDFEGEWQRCDPDTVASFSAVGYFYARQLHQTLGVPVGLIHNAWGGSAAEAWVARDVLEADGRFERYLAEWRSREVTFDFEAALANWMERSAAARASGKRVPPRPGNILAGQHRPGNLWAGVLSPVIGYGIRGVIWYQGESNSSRADPYDELFALLIGEWRNAWGQGDFPFYWVQLADFRAEVDTPTESAWAELREAQTKTLALPNTGQAVIYDVGEGRDIHPRDKQTVAMRLARIALARDYGYAIDFKSPSVDTVHFEGGKVIVAFKNVGSSLYTFDVNTVLGFAIAGEDRVWHWADAELTGKDRVVVSSKAVPEPVAVRYAWADNPVANLMSREGLPVVPFRTDDWPLSTQAE